MSAAHDNFLPRGALLLAGAMVLLALGVTTVVRVADVPPSASPVALRTAQAAAPLASRDLRFIDRADGSVLIEDVRTGAAAAVIPSGGESGFIRGVMRGLARERRQHGIGDGPAFRLTQWEGGQLSLTDLATGRDIELNAFGATNRKAFADLLPGAAL